MKSITLKPKVPNVQSRLLTHLGRGGSTAVFGLSEMGMGTIQPMWETGRKKGETW